MLNIVISEDENSHFCQDIARFWAFPVLGPTITSRAVAREVMVGPRTGNARKTGNIEAEMGILHRENVNI